MKAEREIKVLFTGEGITDFGSMDEQRNIKEGPVAVFFRRIAEGHDIAFSSYTRSELKNMRKPGFQRGLKGLDEQQKQALFLADRAASDGYDIVAFFSDSDNPGGGRNTDEHACRANYDALKEKLTVAMERGRQGRSLKILVVIAMKMIESWIMSDPAGFRKLWGNARGVDFPSRPELEWGDQRDPESNFPKNRLDRIMDAFHQESGQYTYNMIAEIADLDEIAARCPVSFGDFIKELGCILEQLDTEE